MDVFGPPPPSYFEERIRELLSLRNDYVSYVNRVAPAVLAGGPHDRSAERTKLYQRCVKAQRAMDASGVKVYLKPPPVAADKPVLDGLAQVAFAWEDSTYQAPSGRQAFDLTVDAIDTAVAYLGRWEEDARRRRQQPTYWVDRFLRAVLGFPAYLISLVFGFDRRDLPEGGRRALWILSVAADIAGVYGLGVALGWW